MSFKNIAIFGVALAVLAIFFLVIEPTQKESVPELMILEAPEKANVLENVSIKIKAIDQSTVTNVTFKVLEEEKKEECGKKECIVVFSKNFEKSGTYELEFIAENSSLKKTSKKIFIQIFDNKKTCIDLTGLNECSKQQPLFCLEGSLIENCDTCGCPEGTKCSLEKCIATPKKLAFVSADPKLGKIVKANENFFVNIVLINQENEIVVKGAEYLVKAKIIGEVESETEKKIVLNNSLERNDSFEIEVEVIGLMEGTYSLELELIAEQELIDSLSLTDFIQASNESVPPLAPTGLKASFEDETLVLEWNPNTETDLAGYLLYKSNSINPTHIKYSQYRTIDKNTTKIRLPELGLKEYYFVIKAFDYLSNESLYSQSVKAEKG